MSWKRKVLEAIVGRVSSIMGSSGSVPSTVSSIFVLRNNDIGDLLVVTPLFEALKWRFPKASITAGVGGWNLDVLKNNPFVDRILEINAPWHNKNCLRFPHNSLRGLAASARYILLSPEVRKLRENKFDVGIDVLGSPEGSFLFLRAGIPFRLGVRGYAGGHSACQGCVQFNRDERVGSSALHFAELLGATDLPDASPQIFLTPDEIKKGQDRWSWLSDSESRRTRIVIGPGGGFLEKCWPQQHFIELICLLRDLPIAITIVGGKQDAAIAANLAKSFPGARNLAGELTLRDTFGLVAASDLVLCNSSMLMHVAAAFKIPSIVLLGEYFQSASQHSAQWGHPGLTRICGRDKEHGNIFAPAEVLNVVREMIQSNLEA